MPELLIGRSFGHFDNLDIDGDHVWTIYELVDAESNAPGDDYLLRLSTGPKFRVEGSRSIYQISAASRSGIVGEATDGVAVGDGIVVLNDVLAESSVTIVNSNFGVVRTIDLSETKTHGLVDLHAIAVGAGSLWVGGNAAVYRYGVEDGELQARIDLPSSDCSVDDEANQMVFGGGALYVEACGTLSRIDPSLGAVAASVQIGGSQWRFRDEAVYVLEADPLRIERLDGTTLGTTGTIRAPATDVPASGNGFAIGDGAAWFTVKGGVYRVDLAS